MKRLYVGCRVRILWSNTWPELAGQEGRIVNHSFGGGLTGDCEWRVAPDLWGSFIAPNPTSDGGDIFAPNSRQLEPIQDPGHQVISWEEMRGIWQPQGVEA